MKTNMNTREVTVVLTATQQQAAWQAVAKALRDGKHCAADVSEERARNIVMALSEPMSLAEQWDTIVSMLHDRVASSRLYYAATDALAAFGTASA